MTIKYLKEDEVEKLLSNIPQNSEVYSAVLLMWLTGARVSEVLSLRREHVDLDTKTLYIPTLKRRRKGQLRILPIANRRLTGLLQKLTTGKKPNDILIPISRQAVWKALKMAAKNAGIPVEKVHPHTLRHSFAIALLRSGAPTPVLQRTLGHAALQSTQIYLELSGEDLAPFLKKLNGKEKKK